MPIYKGSNKLKELQFGNIKIKEVYYGSQLVYTGIKPELITESITKLLSAGSYKYIAVGAGAGGGNGGKSSAATRSALSGKGGSGGGSGYITTGTFILTNTQNVTFNIGIGGAGIYYGDGNLSRIQEGGSTSIISSDGTVNIVASGGAPTDTAYPNAGGNGGSGGGSSTIQTQLTTGTVTPSQINDQIGSSGAYGGGNGASKNTITHKGGVGVYNIDGLLANNNGDACSESHKNGGPGKGGKGLVSLYNSGTSLVDLLKMDIEDLYQHIQGGGGGGGSYVQLNAPETWYGGSGGGGAGWFDGDNANDDQIPVSGKGGNGAIILLKI